MCVFRKVKNIGFMIWVMNQRKLVFQEAPLKIHTSLLSNQMFGMEFNSGVCFQDFFQLKVCNVVFCQELKKNINYKASGELRIFQK